MGAGKVRAYRTMFQSVADLRHEVNSQRAIQRRWKHRTIALGIVALVALGGFVAAISSTTKTFEGITGETYKYNTATLTVTTQGHSVAPSTLAAAGITNTLLDSIEMATSSGGAANTALTAGNWVFQAKVDEAGINTVASITAYYKVELFLDGTSKGAVYVKNAVLDITAVEGVTVKWDLGASLPTAGAYVIKVTQSAT